MVTNELSAKTSDSDASLSEMDTGLPRIGDLVAAKFRIDSVVGSGGMGVVFGGQHTLLQTQIAIKFLRKEFMSDSNVLSRFLQEARLAASIENEHCTRIYDFGTTETNVPYIVMEFLRGESLDQTIEQQGHIAVADAVTIAIQVLSVLAEAHGKGLVHRDLKPANLFLQERNDGGIWTKVLDFGISKYIEASPISKPNLTAPRTPLGSPQYMSPEQLRDSSSVDQRSDIWSMGIVLHEMLSGSVPFDAQSVAELYGHIINDPPTRLRKVRGDVPPGLEQTVLKCLEKDPSLRPQHAGELASLLAPYAPESVRGQIQAIQAASAKSQRSRDRSGSLVIEARPFPARPKLRPRSSAVLGLALVAAAGVAAYVVAPYLIAKPPNRPMGALAAPIATFETGNITSAAAVGENGTGRMATARALTNRDLNTEPGSPPTSGLEARVDLRQEPQQGENGELPTIPTGTSDLTASGTTSPGAKRSAIDAGAESKKPAVTIAQRERKNRAAPAPQPPRIRSSKQITPIE